jgi:hypothetical protein
LSFGAQKVLPASPGKVGAAEPSRRIILGSKTNRLFPVDFANPSSYQRLVLVSSPNQ